MTIKTSYASALSPEYALLGLLAQQPAHGYELHQRLSSDLGQIWHISLSQIYNILNRLEAQGLITGSVQEQDKLPARRRFQLTQAGSQRFKSWLEAPSGCSVRAIRVEFTTRLYFTWVSNPELADCMIESQIAAVQEGLARLRVLLADVPTEQIFNRFGLKLRVQQLASILEWLADCREALRFSYQEEKTRRADEVR